uniref:RIIa domain-containing protein n=1 Tax=Anopheles christyi TaxID=43041 RepID=A0A182JWW3_9DIPT
MTRALKVYDTCFLCSMSKMVLLQEIYCPEQIVIPKNFHITLKQYAKAVIRTQPFDLLRWSAAYFRSLALNVQPPVKSRYESSDRHEHLTTGMVRVLIDQLGKGYYVYKKILLEKWEGLCLPEEDLLNVLSLLRMLNWSQLHWLKIVAVFIGQLCADFARTAQMICEMLTEDPEGGAASIPFWMFRECFLAVADLDCSSVQKFVNGRKVLDEDTGAVEEEQMPPALPKVLSTISFKNAIIDKYRSTLHDEFGKQNFTLYRNINIDDNEQLSEPSAVPSRLESDFKFFGDDTDAHEVLRRAPDFDSVIVLLKRLHGDGAISMVSESTLSKAALERTRERSKQIEELKVSISEEEYYKLKEQERQELLKEMGPPWLLLYLFSQDCSRTKSFNYVEQSTTSISDDSVSAYSMENIYEDTLELDPSAHGHERRKSNFSLPVTLRARMSVSSHSAAFITNEILSKVVCSIDQAIVDGECELTVGSIANYLEQKSNSTQDFIASTDHEKLQSFLKEAESRELEVKDINELYNFFVSESFKRALQENDNEPQQKEIFSIFGESGIDVDANLLESKISDNMILGLVAPPPIEEPSEDAKENSESVEVTAVLPTPSMDTLLPIACEGTTQTDPIEIACVQRKIPLAPTEDQRITYKCKISPIPGIGGPLDETVRDAFLTYLAQRAIDQQGLVYPRNFREVLCPRIGSFN